MWRTRLLRYLLALTWLGMTFWIVPEGLAVVYAHRHGGGPVAAGLLTAALPCGQAIGAFAFLASRFANDQLRSRLLLPLAVLSFVPLVFTALEPGLVLTFVLWVVAGIGSSLNLFINRMFARVVPDTIRGRAFGLAVSGYYAAQGLGLLVAGLCGDRISAGTVIAGAGVLGLLGVAALAVTWPYLDVANAANVPSSVVDVRSRSITTPETVST
jgi:MFS family permease